MAGQTQLIPENLPVGWRFDPTDVELFTHYLIPKLLNQPIYGSDVRVVDLSKYDPWTLLAQFRRNAGNKEIYFFCACEYNKSSGNRKRKAGGGYWKCTGNPRPVRLEDSDDEIGTKRCLVFHNPDATEFTITEYACTAELNSHIMEDFVLCKLKKKSNKNKSTSKKIKDVKPDHKNKRRPNKKARKAESLDGNTDLASALTSENQNLKEMVANSACSEGEQSNHMASYLEKQHPNKTTAILTYKEGELIYLKSTQNIYERTDIPTCSKDESTCPTANQMTTTMSHNKGNKEGIATQDFGNQNPTKNTDISISKEGESNPFMVAPSDFDNQNQCNEADMSLSENFWSSLLGSTGDPTSQYKQSGEKDMPILQDNQVPLMASNIGDSTFFETIDIEEWLEKCLEPEESHNSSPQQPTYRNQSLNLSGFGTSLSA